MSGLQKARFSLAGGIDRIVNGSAVVGPELWQEVKSNNPNSVMHEFLEPIISNTTRLDRMLALEQRYFLTDHNLNYTDKMSMAAGVEVRVPFLDKDLVEFASNIPNKYKQTNSTGKWVLKKAMEEYLPIEIITNSKLMMIKLIPLILMQH